MVPALRKDVREDLAFFSGGCSRSSSCESRICVDFTRERGFFFEPKRFFGAAWLWFGYAYLAAMIARAILLWDHPIPIFFHGVLAAFVIAVGHSHRRRLGA